MAPIIQLAATGTDDTGIELDLRDEEHLLAADRAEYDVEGVRALLWAINLRPSVETARDESADVVDLAVFRATGSTELATIFSR